MEAVVALGKNYSVLFCGILAAFGVLGGTAVDAASMPASASAMLATATEDSEPSPAPRGDRAPMSANGPESLGGDIQTDYTLSLDTVRAELGESVAFEVRLDNAWPVQGFDVLIYYDPSTFWTAGVTASGTRAADFEYFDYQFDIGGVPGQVRIQGVCSQSGATQRLLAPGSGAVARLLFKVVDDAEYADLWIPVRFVAADPLSTSPVLTDAAGRGIDRENIQFHDGWLAIAPLAPTALGDINLNGVGVEVSDYVLFTNHIIDPYQYPFSARQRAASDLNRDRVPATIADLVTLINMISRGEHYQGPVGGNGLFAKVSAERGVSGVEVSYDSDFDLGGVLVVLRSDDDALLNEIRLTSGRMRYQATREGRDLRIFVYSLDGEVLPAGQRCFMTIEGLNDFELVSVDASSADGRTADVLFSTSGSVLPEGFELRQNYPNPFNPGTRIGFSLREASWVTLDVLDLLGRRVRVLADGDFAAGDHEIAWDGHTSQGEPAASGVYFYRLETGGGSMTRKMMLMK